MILVDLTVFSFVRATNLSLFGYICEEMGGMVSFNVTLCYNSIVEIV